MKKPPSFARRAIRDLQLVVSVGGAILILYALINSAMVMHLELPPVSSAALRLLIRGLLSHGSLMVLAPVICFGVRRVVDINPWRLGIGATAFVEAALLAVRWVVGGFDEDGFDSLLAVQLAATVAACALSGFAASVSAKRVAKLEAAEAAALAASPAGISAARPDLAEEMRRIQDAAREPVTAPAEVESAAPVVPPKA